MKTKTKLNLIRFFTLALVCIMLILALPLSGSTQKAYASESVSLDDTYVLDDLEGAVFNGKTFSLKDYAPEKNRKAQVFSFFEWGYSSNAKKQGDYALYVYVWNPEQLNIKKGSNFHSITMNFGVDSFGYSKYDLEFINSCNEPGYENVILKFKVKLSSSQKSFIFNLFFLQGQKRTYKLGEIQLSVFDYLDVKTFAIGKNFTYTGYLKGYDPNSLFDTVSTLKSTFTSAEILSLDVETTYYHEPYKGSTYLTLHTAYFAVPKTALEKYPKGITNAHAEYFLATLKPGLVIGNQDARLYFEAYIGKSMSVVGESIPYFIASDYEWHPTMNGRISKFHCNYLLGATDFTTKAKNELDNIYLIFDSGVGLNTADSYKVSSTMLKEKLDWFSEDYFSEELVAGKYQSFLFSEYDTDARKSNFSNLDSAGKLVLKELYNEARYDKLTEEEKEELAKNTYFSDATQIKRVVDNDFYKVGTHEKDTDLNISKRLYIHEGDVDSFTKFYEENKEENYIYMIRYHVSKSISEEAGVCTRKNHGFLDYYPYTTIDTNAYFFQNEVSLNFDIIDVTVSDGEKEYILPVAQTPVDNIIGTDPPTITTDDDEGCSCANFFSIFLILLIPIGIWMFFSFDFFKDIINNIWLFIKKVFQKLYRLIKSLFSKMGSTIKAKSSKKTNGKRYKANKNLRRKNFNKNKRRKNYVKNKK